MFLFNLLDGEANGGGSNPWFIVILIGFLAIVVVMSIINNKKRKKQAAEEMKTRDSLCKGTTVITIGGICGTVVSVDHEESTFVMESEGSKIKFDKRAIYKMTLPEEVQKVEEVKEEVKEEVSEEPKA